MYCVSSSKYPESTIKRRGMDWRVDIAVTNHFSESALVMNHPIGPIEWSTVADILAEEGRVRRSSKQCRER